MNKRKPTDIKIRELYEMVKQIDASVKRARTTADEIELLSTTKTLDACGAIIERLLESLSAPLIDA